MVDRGNGRTPTESMSAHLEDLRKLALNKWVRDYPSGRKIVHPDPALVLALIAAFEEARIGLAFIAAMEPDAVVAETQVKNAAHLARSYITRAERCLIGALWVSRG